MCVYEIFVCWECVCVRARAAASLSYRDRRRGELERLSLRLTDCSYRAEDQPASQCMKLTVSTEREQ